MTVEQERETREIDWRGGHYRFAVAAGEPRPGTTVLSVSVDGRPLGRIDSASSLDALSRTELEALAERARLNVDLNRWEGEGGSPPPG